MTQAGVLVANTPNAVPRPVATIALTFILALAHRLMAKDRITRAGAGRSGSTTWAPASPAARWA